MSRPQDINTAGERRLKYGVNLAIVIVALLVLVGMGNFVLSRYYRRFDWTTGGIYSLSEQTKVLIKQIDEKKMTVELAHTFDTVGSVVPGVAEQGQLVKDLLDEYTRRSTNIKLYQLRNQEDLLAKIKERYSGETKPYETAVGDFGSLNKNLQEFFKTEAANFGQLAQQGNLGDEERQELTAVQSAFGSLFPEALNKTQKAIRRQTESTLPAWSKASTSVKSVLEQVTKQLQLMTDAESLRGLSAPVQAYFKKESARYQQTLADVKAFKDRLDKLPTLKVDEIVDSLNTNPNNILVFGPSQVRVIASTEIFKSPQRDPNEEPQGAPSFEGEQSISSVLLSMVRPNKTKVVFVGGPPPSQRGDLFGDVKDRLTKANFEVLAWNPPAPPNPQNPQQEPSSPEPPASGKDVLFVVMPPEPNQQMMMMGMPNDPSALVNAVSRHMEQGGNALFLAEASNPMMGMMGGPGGGGYPFADLIKPFGVEVKANYWVVQSYPGRDGVSHPTPQVRFNRFPDSPITKPLQALDTIFFGGGRGPMGPQGAPTVVSIATNKPADATAQVLVETPPSREIWAESSPMTNPMKFDPGVDLASPVPMGVASTLKSGKKVVVFGNKLFASDMAMQSGHAEIRDGMPVMVSDFPGNAELFLNSVNWLTGYENMIAVSARASAAQRIGPMSENLLWTIRILLFTAIPLGALGLGFVIYAVRRR